MEFKSKYSGERQKKYNFGNEPLRRKKFISYMFMTEIYWLMHPSLCMNECPTCGSVSCLYILVFL